MHLLSQTSPLPTVEADLLVVAVKAGGLAPALAAVDGADGLGGVLATVTADDEFTGKAGSTLVLHAMGKLRGKRLLLVGVGAGSAVELRNAAGTAGTQARQRGAKTVALAWPGVDVTATDVRNAAEAFAEGNYRFDKYKAESARKAACESLLFLNIADGSLLGRAAALIAGQNLARDLVNEPAAEIYPQSLAAVASGLRGEHLTVSVLDEVQIREKGMGGISGVGQGSARPPRFVEMTYTPPGASKGHICFVGKGVTFDSGGLSLKPNDGMLTMRCDMAGAAAVIGAMRAIAELHPAVKVTGIFGAVENMPSGTSYKLGDILKMYNGKRVEIHNTDAEGRLVLADCLAYASELKPDAVVDLATLTGAAVIALGDWYSALYTRTDAFADTLLKHAGDAGEGLWRMPLPELYRDKLKAEWGDLKNVGGRAAGSITAALFLSEFVTVPTWAHVDIAGPAFMDTALMHYVQGGTGTMVRTLARWAESYGV